MPGSVHGEWHNLCDTVRHDAGQDILDKTTQATLTSSRVISLKLLKHSDQHNTLTKVRFKLSNPTLFIIHFLLQVNLLNKVLGIVAGVLLLDHDVRATDFQQIPHRRIFIMLFLEVYAPYQILETINFQVLTAYCNMVSILKPDQVVSSSISKFYNSY